MDGDGVYAEPARWGLRRILIRVESRDPETSLPVPVVCLAVGADLLLVQFGIAVSAGDALPGEFFVHLVPQ